VWHISSSYNDPTLFATCYSSLQGGDLTTGCKLWKLPPDVVLSDEGVNGMDQLSQHSFGSIEEMAEISSTEISRTTQVQWKPLEDDAHLMVLGDGIVQLWDVVEESPRLVSSFKVPDRKGHQGAISNGRWNPHHGARQFAVACGQNVIGWDVRENASVFKMDSVHGQSVRDVDYNPNKQYHMLTCGDDCLVKFWDIRSPASPISVIEEEHSHWVWSARFNPFHDQLVLSGGSDSRVILYNKASISSEPYGQLNEGDDDEEASDDGGLSEPKEPPKDGLIAIFEEHEDSVYCVEWSAADPWSFASLSYDGRVVINKVPKKVKYDILL